MQEPSQGMYGSGSEGDANPKEAHLELPLFKTTYTLAEFGERVCMVLWYRILDQGNTPGLEGMLVLAMVGAICQLYKVQQ